MGDFFNHDSVERSSQSDDVEMTQAKLSDSPLEGNFSNTDCYGDEGEESGQTTMDDKENKPLAIPTNQASNIQPKNVHSNFSISFSNGKFAEDLLVGSNDSVHSSIDSFVVFIIMVLFDFLKLNESANILIDNSGNKSRLEFNHEGLNSKNLTLNTSLNNFSLNASDSSRINDVNNMIIASIERVKRIGIKSSSDREVDTNNGEVPMSQNRCLSATSSGAVQSKVSFKLGSNNRCNGQPSWQTDVQDSFKFSTIETVQQCHDSKMALRETQTSARGQDGLLNLAKSDEDRQHLTLSSSIYFKSAGAPENRDQDSFFNITTQNTSLDFQSAINFSCDQQRVSGSNIKQFHASFGAIGAPLDSSNEWKANFSNTDDFLNELKKAEQVNRQEFASNELTIANIESSGDENWWNVEMNNPQSSKLELSSLSNNSSSEAMTSVNLGHSLGSGSKKQPSSDQKLDLESPSKKLKPITSKPTLHTSSSSLNGTDHHQRKAICVDEYFNKKSAMPLYLAEKDSDIGGITATPLAKSLPETRKMRG